MIVPTATRRRLLLLALLLGAGTACSRPLPGSSGTREAACRAAREEVRGSPGARLVWIVPAGEEGRALRDWCAAVGPAVALPGPSAGTPPPLDSLVVLTWNVFGGGGDLTRLVEDLRAGRLTEGSPVDHFVLLLQEAVRIDPSLPRPPAGSAVPEGVVEAPPGGERVDVVRASRALGLSLLYVPSMRNGRRTPAEDRGNAVLSTLPLKSPRAVELPLESQRRVVAAATVEGSASDGSRWRLQVASAHLDTRSAGRRLWASFGEGRRRQAEALANGLDPDLPTVVGGDLNTWSLAALEGAVPLLLRRFPQSPPPLDEPTFATSWGFRRRLDHMFFRLPEAWSGRFRRVDARYGSDHHPLLAWVRFAARDSAPGPRRQWRSSQE